MTQSQTSLHKSPFAVLGVTTRDNRVKIVERAEELALHGDQEEAQKARSALTIPRARLSAEIAWLPGVSPRTAETLLQTVSHEPLETRLQNGLPNLAKANLMAAAVELVDLDQVEPQDLADFMQALGDVAEGIDSDDVLRDVNEDRSVAGFPEVRDATSVEEEIEARKRIYRNALKSTLNNLQSAALIETMTILVSQATDDGESLATSLVDDLVDSFRDETLGFLAKEQDTIEKLIGSVLAAAPAGSRQVDALLPKLELVVRNWSRVAKPIQLSLKARGIDDDHSLAVAHSIRSLGLDLYNTHELLEQTERTTRLLQEVFIDLPEFAERVQGDAAALQNLKQQHAASVQRNAEWEKAITYRGQIGVVFKDELSISPAGISWKNKTYPLASINGVRWGAVRNSVNGIPTGTDYTIAFGDSHSSSVVSLSKEAIYSKFIECLWRAICVRLLVEMCNSLKAGNTLSFGNIEVRNSSVQVERHKVFGANQFLWLPFSDVHVWSENGNFVVGSKTEKTVYSTSSYIHHWNTHILEHLIRGAFKQGVGAGLSTYMES